MSPKGLVGRFSDEQLLSGMKKCLDDERKQVAWFLVALGEVDRRSLYAEMGYPSLYEFCVRELGLSESSALTRIQVARLGARFQEVYCLIESGEHSLSSLRLLSPKLTWQNKAGLLEETKGKSKREVERILQKRFPEDKQQSVALQFDANNELEAKLQKARELLSHKYPAGKLEDILGEALSALLAQIDPDLAKPSIFTKKARENSRYMPRGIRLAVWKRDGGACCFVSATGRKCGSRKYLEWDHITPFAHGGLTNVENLRLLCRAHNQLEAHRKFGKSYLERRIDEQRAFRVSVSAPIPNPLSHRYG